MRKNRKRKTTKAPYVILGLVALTLFSLEFFYHLGHSKRDAVHSHLLGGDVQSWFVELMTGMDLSRIGAFVGEGLGFGGLQSEPLAPLASPPSEFRFFRNQNLVYEPADIEAVTVRTPVELGEEPIVLLINTHTHERFNDGLTTVMDITRLIGDIFEANGIPVFKEYRSVEELTLELFGPRSFHLSYDASRVMIEERKAQFPSLRFFFDVHRDSPVSDPWIQLNGNDYARVFFALGTRRNPNYQENLAVTMEMVDLLEQARPGIMRNRPIQFLDSPGSDARFNQDISPYMQLVEFGDNLTPVHAAKNSARVFAEVMSEFILSRLAAEQE